MHLQFFGAPRKDILTLKCPTCHQAFVDFDACFALTCGRCGSGLCAWCGRFCGLDAHEHVRRCPSSLSPGNLFGSQGLFAEASRRRKLSSLSAFLRDVEVEARRPLLRALRGDIQDLGLSARLLLRVPRASAAAVVALALVFLLAVSLALNARLWRALHDPGMSAADVCAEVSRRTSQHVEGVRGRYDLFLREITSDVKDLYWDLRDGVSGAARGDLVTTAFQVVYTSCALPFCFALGVAVWVPTAAVARLHTAVLARHMQWWYLQGGRWMGLLRALTFLERGRVGRVPGGPPRAPAAGPEARRSRAARRPRPAAGVQPLGRASAPRSGRPRGRPAGPVWQARRRGQHPARTGRPRDAGRETGDPPAARVRGAALPSRGSSRAASPRNARVSGGCRSIACTDPVAGQQADAG
ncbi:unnamed protein product, partial [Prorocentrum cordatum]